MSPLTSIGLQTQSPSGFDKTSDRGERAVERPKAQSEFAQLLGVQAKSKKSQLKSTSRKHGLLDKKKTFQDLAAHHQETPSTLRKSLPKKEASSTYSQSKSSKTNQERASARDNNKSEKSEKGSSANNNNSSKNLESENSQKVESHLSNFSSEFKNISEVQKNQEGKISLDSQNFEMLKTGEASEQKLQDLLKQMLSGQQTEGDVVATQQAMDSDGPSLDAEALQNLKSQLNASGLIVSNNFDGAEGDGSSEGQSKGFEHFVGQAKNLTTNSQSVQNKDFAKALVEMQNQGQKESIDNMSSVVKQVRTFIKDGGGSMKIELSPEGMGQLNLKVSVKEGQVSVEMLADNMAAKKALEEGLFDMKASLESQKLLVDTVKVDLSKDFNKDFSDPTNFAQEQENRDFAQQFMEQFHRGREERASHLFDGLRSYMREAKDPETILDRSRGYFGPGKGQRLNVVA